MRRRAFALVILLLILLAAFAPPSFAVTPDDWDADNPGALVPEHLYAQTAVLIDFETGDVLFDKDSQVRMYPASTTKIMTVLLALESDIALDEEVTIPDVAQNVPSDSSLVPVYAGEVMTFEDLLYGTMLCSGNDGANAHGYHDETHYSTAYDLALIAQTAMQNETFRQIVSTARYTMAPTVNRGAYNITNTAEMVNPDSGYYYEGCIGIKTGFHSRAGHCFVGAVSRDGVSMISVVLRSTSESSNTTAKWWDTRKLFEYGFAQYEPYLLTDLFDASSRSINTVTIPNAASDDAQRGLLEVRLTQLSNGEYTRRIRSGSEGLAEALADFAARTEITYNEDLRAPIDEGEIIGTLTYTAPDGEVITGMLSAERAVAARPEYATVYDVLPFLIPLEPFFSSGAVWYVLVALAILIVALLILRARRRAARNRRRAAIYNAKRRAYNYAEAERRRTETQRQQRERQRRQAAPRQDPRRRPPRR